MSVNSSPLSVKQIEENFAEINPAMNAAEAQARMGDVDAAVRELATHVANPGLSHFGSETPQRC